MLIWWVGSRLSFVLCGYLQLLAIEPNEAAIVPKQLRFFTGGGDANHMVSHEAARDKAKAFFLVREIRPTLILLNRESQCRGIKEFRGKAYVFEVGLFTLGDLAFEFGTLVL